jgi:hypothetical protein
MLCVFVKTGRNAAGIQPYRSATLYFRPSFSSSAITLQATMAVECTSQTKRDPPGLPVCDARDTFGIEAVH